MGSSRTGRSLRQARVIGAGGHAKVVIGALRESGFTVTAVYDDDPQKWGGLVAGIEVAGAVAEAEAVGPPAVVAIGDNAGRRRVVEAAGCDWLTVTHPAAVVDPSVRLGPGTVVMAGAVVQADAAIGGHVILNTASVVEHDCDVGGYAHVGPTACLAGGVRVGAGALVGAGAVVLPGRRVGAWAVVGAGAAVNRDVDPDAVVAGVPARAGPRRGEGRHGPDASTGFGDS